MRERLIALTVGLTLAVIALFGVPRAYTLSALVRDQQTAQVDRTADDLALLVAERGRGGGTVDPTLLGSILDEGDRAEYVAADGTRVASGSPVDGDGAIVETRSVGDGATVTVTRPGQVVSDRVSRALQPLVTVGLLLALAAALVGYVLARRISRPFRELAEAASMLGRGRFDLAVPHYGVPEADEIGTSLRRTATELEQMVRREREFAANASHQLRTPITALRLGLEDLSLWPEASPAVRDQLEVALGEVDRLSAVIDDLVALARETRDGMMADVDLVALVRDSTDRWRSPLKAQGRGLRIDAPETMPARVAPGPVSQVLDVLVDNALTHGVGPVTVTVRDLETHLSVAVADAGSPPPGPEVFRRGVSTRPEAGDGHGIGLAVASELAELYGANLSIDPGSPTTTFVLLLPQRRTSDRPVLED
ncbi:MAG TPA: HAMP domain-containing sensor histidine kinase [Nocardioides sp.]|nr:HAMP domain-containing sensor histidine kinase [Nocardioides sp.]